MCVNIVDGYYCSTTCADTMLNKKGLRVCEASDDWRLTNLRFADDVVLIGGSLAEVKLMLADRMVSAERRGLTIHPDKTKTLSNIKTKSGIQKEDKTQVAGKHIEIIPYEGYIKYLGRKVGFSSFRDMEVDNRVFAAWANFHSMKDV